MQSSFDYLFESDYSQASLMIRTIYKNKFE